MTSVPEIISLINTGKSLNQIVKLTGANKSSIYYHYRKLKGRKLKKVVIDETDAEKIGEFLGVFAGDGNFFFYKKLYRYSIKISTGLYEKQYALFLNKFLTAFFHKAPSIYTNIKYNVIVTGYISKDIYLLLKKYLYWNNNKTKSVKLIDVQSHSNKFLIGFIRGLFDTDGGIYKPKKKIALGTSSEQLAYQVRQILGNLGIPSGFYKYKNKDFWYIDMYGTNSDRFMKLIKPNNSNKIL